jgi:hypothetical protein
VTERARSLAALSLLAGLAIAAACSSFEESDDGPAPPDDAAATEVASPDALPVDAGDASNADAAVTCEPEPVWATSGDGGAPKTATCDGMMGVDLLTSKKHCGRCDHSCSGDECKGGYCEPLKIDSFTVTSLLTVGGGAIYYLLSPSNVIRRLVLGSAPTTVATFKFDAGGPDEVLVAAAIDGDTLWLRNRFKLFRTSITNGPMTPDLVGPLPYDTITSIVPFDGKLRITASSADGIGGRVLVVDTAGAPPYAPNDLVNPSLFAGAAARAGTSYVWLEQPWASANPAPSRVRLRDSAGNNVVVHTDVGDLGGLAIDGDQAFSLRRGDGGGVVKVDLITQVPTVVASDAIANSYANANVAVDATHVYWIRDLQNNTHAAILKRARCGGESIVIAPDLYGARQLVSVGGRLVIGTYEGVAVLAK